MVVPLLLVLHLDYWGILKVILGNLVRINIISWPYTEIFMISILGKIDLDSGIWL
jgi:hypothetical protein